jgi:hypothetical protein
MADRAATAPVRAHGPAPSVRAVRRNASDSADESERSLARGVALVLPLLGVAAAITIGFVASLGSALLVLAASALIGAIALLWASVRTLSGDAPLPEGLVEGAIAVRGVDALSEEKGRILRSLKDVEGEHALGKMDDADHEALVAQYRNEAKAVMRELDRLASPGREKAERVAHDYLKRGGLLPQAQPSSPGLVVEPAEPAAGEPARRSCPSCSASNEADATFCKACGAPMAKPKK